MTTELYSEESATDEVVDLNPAETPRETLPAAISMVESVAKVVSGISVIGHARDALTAAGWTATTTANRITVDAKVLAQLIPAKFGAYGLVDARWVVYPRDGEYPVWIVGADR
jgi:hypothetical protein